MQIDVDCDVVSGLYGKQINFEFEIILLNSIRHGPRKEW
jgi:hypothetical protein